MILHFGKLVFCVKSNNFSNQVLQSINEILKGHLIMVKLVSHDFDENQVVIIFGDFFAGHPSKGGQFGKLRSSKDPFGSNRA